MHAIFMEVISSFDVHLMRKLGYFVLSLQLLLTAFDEMHC